MEKRMTRGCCLPSCIPIHEARRYYCCGSKLPAQESDRPSQPKKKDMSCGCCSLSCFSSQEAKQFFCRSKTAIQKSTRLSQSAKRPNTADIEAKELTFRKIAAITKNFRQECLIGEGGFGRVYKGAWDKTGKVVAVKLLDRTLGLQPREEFLSEVSVLSHLKHVNLVNLVGFCAHGDQRVLVYDYMEMGSLEDQLHLVSQDRKPLDWLTRMRIAFGVAKGLEYLHCMANPPVIYGNLKSSNVLLGKSLNAELSDLRAAKHVSAGHKQQEPTTRAMGVYGYCAPEYQTASELTVKSDIYSFGVMMLELISGRRVIDLMRMSKEQNLVAWAQPIFRDPARFSELVDPVLEGDFVIGELQHAVATAAICLQEDADVRPLITDVVHALSFLGDDGTDEAANSHHVPSQPNEQSMNALNPHASRNLSISFKFPNTNSFSF